MIKHHVKQYMFLKYLTNKSIRKTVQMDTESFQIGEIEFIKKKPQNINKNGGQTGRRSNVNFKIENIKR